METIESFRGRYGFLSNFWMCPVSYAGRTYSSSEHAYQAAKTMDMDERKRIQALRTAGEAKRLGRTLKLRENWEQVKVEVMRAVLTSKFKDNPDLAILLVQTGEAKLVEWNHWGDTFWGVCGGVGRNMLGVLLMEIRAQLREKQDASIKQA